jgi:pimeloyl-ACP methyl ester carboxylesterase
MNLPLTNVAIFFPILMRPLHFIVSTFMTLMSSAQSLLSLDHKLFLCPKRPLSQYPDIIDQTNSTLVPVLHSDYHPDWFELLTDGTRLHPTVERQRFTAYTIIKGSPTPAFTVIFMHGTSDDILSLIDGDYSHGWRIGRRLAENLNARVIVVDYPGCGFLQQNAGWRKPKQHHALAGTRAVLRHLLHSNLISLNQTLIVGQSLGSAMATDLVYGLEQAGLGVAGLALVSPYISIRKAVVDYARISSCMTGCIFTNQFDNRWRVRGIRRTPTRYIHGDKDIEIKPKHSMELLKLQQANPDKQLWLIPGADHGFIWTAEVYRRLRQFGRSVANHA